MVKGIDYIYEGIYLGGNFAMSHMDEIREMGIHAVLRLDHFYMTVGRPAQWEADFRLLHLPFNDGVEIPPGYISQGTHFIHQQLERNSKVLVHCQMGISRSVTMVLAYLIEFEAMNLSDAYALVHSRRSIAYPHGTLLYSLVNHYNLPFTEAEVSDPMFLQTLLDLQNGKNG